MRSKGQVFRYTMLPLLLGFLLQACGKTSNPVSPTMDRDPSAVVPTPTVSAGTSQIFWFSARIARIDDLGELSNTVEVYLSVNGQAEASAQVVLTGGNAPLTIPYHASLNIGGDDYARYYLADGSFQYAPGIDYTLSTATSAGTAWASVTAPGGIQNAPNGDNTRWGTEGTNDRVYIQTSNFAGTYDSIDAQDDLVSVFSIPSSAYPSGGNYFIRTTCRTIVTSVNNSMPGSALIASDEYWSSIYR